MNQKNSLGLDKCFGELDNPFNLFGEWFAEAKKLEPNDPNALALATVNKLGVPSVRMVLLKGYSTKGFIFYTNLNSRKSEDIKINPNASMCFHWKSLLRQIRIVGKINSVQVEEADKYYKSRSYGSRIGAWASKQSTILNSRDELYESIDDYKKKFPEENKVPRPNYWSGWNLSPSEVEFWLDGENRIHQRLKYIKDENNSWKKVLLSP
jgi:pyridoxamine 5'-phosphate oxidase|tara:strand:+ start:5647 stop:6273 length:627 start_codon:yes stop_codon:yes gene_type:complete